VFLSWGPYSGTDRFIVQYGLADGNWLYSTNVTGFSTTLNNLPENQPIWVRVAARNDCSVGIYGASRFTGGPSLPNTGMGSDNKIISWNATAPFATILFALTALVIVLKKTRGNLTGN